MQNSLKMYRYFWISCWNAIVNTGVETYIQQCYNTKILFSCQYSWENLFNEKGVLMNWISATEVLRPQMQKGGCCLKSLKLIFNHFLEHSGDGFHIYLLFAILSTFSYVEHCCVHTMPQRQTSAYHGVRVNSCLESQVVISLTLKWICKK